MTDPEIRDTQEDTRIGAPQSPVPSAFEPIHTYEGDVPRIPPRTTTEIAGGSQSASTRALTEVGTGTGQTATSIPARAQTELGSFPPSFDEDQDTVNWIPARERDTSSPSPETDAYGDDMGSYTSSAIPVHRAYDKNDDAPAETYTSIPAHNHDQENGPSTSIPVFYTRRIRRNIRLYSGPYPRRIG